jgi:hypothetical protein
MAHCAADHKPSYNTDTLVDLIRHQMMAEQLKVLRRLGVDPDVLPKGLNRKARRSRKARRAQPTNFQPMQRKAVKRVRPTSSQCSARRSSGC